MDIHRGLIRSLQHWRSLYEAMEVPDVLLCEGVEFSLWDTQSFYAARLVLPERQQLSIQYCLYENMIEKEAAVRMGIKQTNPVAIYATIGLTSLLTKAVAGDLPGYALTIDPKEHAHA